MEASLEGHRENIFVVAGEHGGKFGRAQRGYCCNGRGSMEASLEGHGEDIVVVAGEAWRQVWKGTERIFL